ncbi:IS4 family transposase [Aliivibrio wodanis]|uniref:IS4 family transposase n=1 Tax=Aliivibrio wodanis TaxID=80852 RepID=UPI00406C192D
MFTTDTSQWAFDTFSKANLGDPRRVKRLISIAGSIANNTGKSVLQSLSTSAEVEAAYRFIRNKTIKPNDISESGFASTVEAAKSFDTLLALEDTTSLSFTHDSVSSELGHTSCYQKATGFQAHSVLLFAQKEQQVVGLIEQHRWTRVLANKGQSETAPGRTYKEKESYKWERASRKTAERMGSAMSKVISVCDREADLIEYLTYKTENQQRFIVRSMQSRRILESNDKLYKFGSALKSAGVRVVPVMQRGGRKAREATCDIRFAPITVQIPSNKRGNPVELYYVSCIEQGTTKGLCWHILTSEPIITKKQAATILECYERRWLIEDFHKSWKTGGTQVENLRMQSKENLEKMVVLLAFIACRIQQLRYLGLQQEKAKKVSCEVILSTKAWKLLWLKREKTRLPKKAQTLYWAYINLGKLAGWHDMKRNGRVGWVRLWEGWFKLQDIVEGYELAQSLESDL